MFKKKKVQRPRLKRYCISNCIFEVYDRYEITNYIGRGGYGIVWYEFFFKNHTDSHCIVKHMTM